MTPLSSLDAGERFAARRTSSATWPSGLGSIDVYGVEGR